MAILIKGVEMPTGNECLILTIYPDGQCFEHVYNGSFGSREERKAVPVPPHGRLIDADELLKRKGDAYDSRGHLLYAVGTGSIVTAPTIIEAEGREDD